MKKTTKTGTVKTKGTRGLFNLNQLLNERDALDAKIQAMQRELQLQQIKPAKHKTKTTKPAKKVKAIKSSKPSKPSKPADPGVLSVVMGPYGTRIAAEQEALQYQHPQVFMYRSALFPVPSNFRVTVEMISAMAIQLETPNVLYPFGVALTLKVTGEPDRVRGWIESFKSRARPLQVL